MLNKEIIKANTEDAELISNLANVIWPKVFSEILTKEQIKDMLEKIYSPQAILKEMLEQGHVYWLAKNNSDYLGYASAYIENETTWLKKIYLKPEAQGLGLGKILMSKATEPFLPQSSKISLYVNQNNKAAQKFYLSQGFYKEKECPVLMGSFKFTDWIMSKDLN